VIPFHLCRDIDLLKCRSFAVVHMCVCILPGLFFSEWALILIVADRFKDEEVLAPDFKEKVADIVRVMKPRVHW
jgi:hypothetical protein